ncbi:MAG TPA: type II secretion system F family protein, partial [Nitrososphaerales archaeon]|nr:type II secretion system F family protein [Nitrososphaerales archaeon]
MTHKEGEGLESRLRLTYEPRVEKLSGLMRQAAVLDDPREIARSAMTRTVWAAAICVPAAVLASLVVPLLGLLGVLPVVVYYLPELKLRDRVSERREGVEKELPFFSILVNVLGGAGMPLFLIFDSVSKTETFRAMKKEALLIKRDVEIFGQNPLETFERVAAVHPSKKFGNFLAGYTSKVRSGGDMPLYLGWQSGALLRELEESWDSYVTRAGVVGSLMVTAFGVVPLLLLTVGFFAPAASVVGLVGFAALGVPALAAVMIAMAGRMQPGGEVVLHGSWARAAAVSVAGVLPGVLLRELWLAIGGAIFLFLLAYGMQVRSVRREREELEGALPRFLGDMLEYKRQEYDLTKALIAVASRNKYSKAFDSMLAKIATSLRAGVPLDEVKLETETKLTSLSIFVLGLMARSGGGSVDTMFQLTQYTSKVQEMKVNSRSEMKPYLILSYLTPLLLVLGVVFVGG